LPVPTEAGLSRAPRVVRAALTRLAWSDVSRRCHVATRKRAKLPQVCGGPEEIQHITLAMTPYSESANVRPVAPRLRWVYLQWTHKA
jgi:hypothetical protein